MATLQLLTSAGTYAPEVVVTGRVGEDLVYVGSYRADGVASMSQWLLVTIESVNGTNATSIYTTAFGRADFTPYGTNEFLSLPADNYLRVELPAQSTRGLRQVVFKAVDANSVAFATLSFQVAAPDVLRAGRASKNKHFDPV